MKNLVIIGASGHGKVVGDIAVRNGYEEIVFLDDNESLSECAGFLVAGRGDDFIRYPDRDFVVAIGNASVRQFYQEKLEAQNYRVVTLIHPQAVIGRRVEISPGTVVMAGAVINSDARIGKGCIVNTCSSIDHDCLIGDYVHVSVGAHVAGGVSIKDRTWIGAGAVVSNGVAICDDCMIGAGAVVVRDISVQGTYVGVPAKRNGHE